MQDWVAGKRVLITGGAGSFGQNFLRAVRDGGCTNVTVFSRDEMKHAALKRRLGPAAGDVDFRIGDITDPEALSTAMRGADLVVHAAAMKHLGECEANVAASNRVNVIGTQAVAHAFLHSNAQVMAFLSTDKAPYASSVYGAQKLVGEKIVTEIARIAGPGRSAFSLRYSNVMDSTGSVFHVFRELLLSNKAVIVNGSQTSRGFVAQSEVIHCLQQLLTQARGGEVLVLIPRVVRILELAHAMRKLLGKGQVNLVEATSFVGEKESATLAMAEEQPVAKEFPAAPHGAVLLDFLARHPQRANRSFPSSALTLEDCQLLSGLDLERFVDPLLTA
jgi:UDP-N-acetylglucosamine 4,6-dehydratase/5-epimerase